MSEPETRLRVLFVTPVALEVASGGGRTAAESFLATLRAEPIGAEVEVLALRTGREILPHRLRQLLALARSAGSSLPAKSLFDARPAAVKRVGAALASRAHDLVVINGGDLFFIAHAIKPDQRCIGLALNVEGELYAQQTARLRRLPLVGRFLARDLDKLRRVETEGLARLRGLVCLSSQDAAAFEALAPDVPILVLPTSFSYPPYERARSGTLRRPLKLGMVAKYRWWPNAEGVEWFARHVLPGLPAGSAELHLYGPGARRFQGRHPAIVVHGFVRDLAEAWETSDIVVCPIVSGSGINIKLVEALYNRNPVLTTRYATRGLPELADPAVVCLETPAEWIAFLAGDRAEALARTQPDQRISDRFSTRAAAPVLAEFLASVMARTP